jgi:hypothetical protein
MSQAGDACAYAAAQVGKPYKFDTAGPDTFDCSGLTLAAYANASPPIILPHFTGAQLAIGFPVKESELEPGDLIFPQIDHVVIYMGNNEVIEAPHQDAFVQRVPYYGMWQARRVTTDGLFASTQEVKAAQAAPALATLASDTLPLDPLQRLQKELGLSGNPSNQDTLFQAAGKVFNLILNPMEWKRLSIFVMGGLLILIGGLVLLRRPIIATVQNVGGSVFKERALTRTRFRTVLSEEKRAGLEPHGPGPSAPAPSGDVHLHTHIRQVRPTSGPPHPPATHGGRPQLEVIEGGGTPGYLGSHRGRLGSRTGLSGLREEQG